jgi:hypothetical protein
MSDIPKQRWGEVPGEASTAKWPVRGELIFWRKGDAERVAEWLARQGFNSEIKAWVEARLEAYAARYPEEKEWRLRDEARLDLLCWQRQFKAARPALDWLREWEEAV